jgi:hypothetical protein
MIRQFSIVVVVSLAELALSVATPASFAAERGAGVAPWADPRLPVANGLLLWLDASRLAEGYAAVGRPAPRPGERLEIWPDGAGLERVLSQVQPRAQPLYQPSGEFRAVRFDGRQTFLQRSELGLSTTQATVFLVSATYSNPGPYSAWLGAAGVGTNDFVTGLNIDQATGSPQAQRLICLAGASWSYDLASQRLAEFCGLSVSDTTIREQAQAHGAQANQWLRAEPAAAKEFRAETGDVEFTTDGTSVNTTDGWREMKLGMFSKRERGAAATPVAPRSRPR